MGRNGERQWQNYRDAGRIIFDVWTRQLVVNFGISCTKSQDSNNNDQIRPQKLSPCMDARLGPTQSRPTCSLASMHLTHGHYERSWGYRIFAMCQVWKSEEPLVVHRSLTWWLIGVCGSLAILLAVHLARTTIKPLQHVSDKYRPTGSDQQEDL